MEVLVMDPKSSNVAYFRREQSGRIIPVGFRELMDKPVRFSTLDGAVVLAYDEEEIPPEECVPFNIKTMNSKNAIKFLEEQKAIGCLFIKVFGIWVQSTVRVLQNRIQIEK